MDVIPVVGKEVARRFHQKVGADERAAIMGGDSNMQAVGSTGAAAVTAEVGSLLTRLWLLGSPNTDAVGHVAESAENIETMVEEMVHFLTSCSTPNLSTLLLQSQGYAFKGIFKNKRRTAEVRAEAISRRLSTAIVEMANASVDEMLGDMTLYTLHKYGQLDHTSAANMPVHRETASVLCSVLPRQQVNAFMRQDPVEKQRQLEEVRRIVWGIRIFNKEMGKSGGAGIEAIHHLTEEPLASIDAKVTNELARIRERLDCYLAVLFSSTGPYSAEELQLLREEYHHLLQVEHSLRTAHCMHHTLAHHMLDEVLQQYDSALAELRLIFGERAISSGGDTQCTDTEVSTAPPKRAVYPQFVRLAEAYETAVRGMEEIEEIQGLMDLALSSESTYSTTLSTRASTEAVAHQNADPVVTNRAELAEEIEAVFRQRPDALEGCMAQYCITPPGTMDRVVEKVYPHLLFALRGFCPVRYAESAILVPGRVRFLEDSSCPGFIVLSGGTGRWALAKPLCFAFSGVAALRAFAANPLVYVQFCMHRCNRVEPGTTLLMGMLDQLPGELYLTGSRRYEAPVSLSAVEGVSKDTATQTGQIDAYKDHNYRWNEWDLRWEALKLANLLNMRTHSSQTAASHFRRDNATQINPPKEEGTQTMQDAATQPPRTVQYLKGLRGTLTSRIEQVQKTFLY